MAVVDVAEERGAVMSGSVHRFDAVSGGVAKDSLPQSVTELRLAPLATADRLATLSLEQSLHDFTEALRGSGELPWPAVVDALIDCYSDLLRQPLQCELRRHGLRSNGVREAYRSWMTDVSVCVLVELRRREPRFGGIASLHCVTALETLDRLMLSAFRNDPIGDRSIIDEAGSIIRSYWAKYA